VVQVAEDAALVWHATTTATATTVLATPTMLIAANSHKLREGWCRNMKGSMIHAIELFLHVLREVQNSGYDVIRGQ
jgi:hypothetical protein